MARGSALQARRAPLLVGFAVALLVAAPVWAQSGAEETEIKNLSAREAGSRLFTDQIRPLFEAKCLACHTGVSKQGELDLSTRGGLLKGGSSGPAIVPGDARASLLYKRITHQEKPAMPLQGEKLPKEVVALVALWIDLGAPFDSPAPKERDLLVGVSTTRASRASGKQLFEEIRPALQKNCLLCHGGKFRQAGLDLSTRETLLRGSEQHGPVVVPGDAAASLLIKKIRHQHEPGMPYQGEKLPDEVIGKIAAWVEAGSPYLEALEMADDAQLSQLLPGSDHWAYQPPQRPALPRVKSHAWIRNPVDAFLAASHEERNLKPMPQADRRTLLRRAYLDLTGLPPTPDEIQEFLNDRSDNAYETTVERLLASPQYGERWGRHWMDVWRYSDWYGLRGAALVQNSQRHLWHWRDWIIESLNEDKGYDRMIREMLAGDELAPTDSKNLRATGYLVRSFFRFNRNAWLRETVEHTAAGFLAMTLKCARCHDHKYDPISQKEYYRFRAFFEPHDVRTDPLPGQPAFLSEATQPVQYLRKSGVPRVFDSEPRDPGEEGPTIYAETYRFIRGDAKHPDKENPLSPAVPEILGELKETIEPVELPLEAYYPWVQPFVGRDLFEQAEQEIIKAEAELTQARQEVSVAARRVAAQQNEDTRKEARESFERELKPIFVKHCIVCHGDDFARNEFRVVSFEWLLEGGIENGPAVIAGKSARSPIIQRLRGEIEPRMPAEAVPLPEETIERIARWIDRLPPEDSKVALRKAREAVALAEKKLAWRKADLPALQARIAADQARFASPLNPKAQDFARVAREAERAAGLRKAEMNLLDAQLKLAAALQESPAESDNARKTQEKRVTLATAQLQAAQEALGKAKDEYSPIGRLYPKTSTGRRTALARWISGRDNPLTARVAINHIWLRHFGEPLVQSVDDFGLRAGPPSHPALLDWLAVEFMENNWSMKHIHRLMVTSSAYRMQSWPSELDHPNLSVDSENNYLWRMNPRRMEAETVRDSLLSVAGELDLTIGGPELDHYTGQTSRRRSLYFTHTPNENMLFLKLFDSADPVACYRRYESIVPQQALALSNSEMSFTQSQLLARKISEKVGDDSWKFVSGAFERVLGRPPSTEEEAESVRFLQQQARLFKNPSKLTRFESGKRSALPPATDPLLRARQSFVHVLINRNEFVTIR